MIKSALTDFKNKMENMSENETEFEQPNKIGNIVENILESKKQWGSGLKILTPSQMLSRLPISLAQLKAENNSEKLCILCTDQKNLPKTFIKIWLTLFKHGNNFYEH